MPLDIGKLYDSIASHYDSDVFGLLSAGRTAAVAQITKIVPSRPRTRIVDLGTGTGESLAALAPSFAGARISGIDLSAEMLAVARRKIDLQAIVANAENVGAHVEDATVDLALMHFLTTFIDVRSTLEACQRALRPGGFLSVVSTTQEAFGALRREIGLRIATDEELRAASPAPSDPDVLLALVRDAGLEIVAVEHVVRKVKFTSFAQCLDFGVKSGFFTHIIASLGEERVQAASQLDALFPIADEYRGVAILAKRPG